MRGLSVPAAAVSWYLAVYLAPAVHALPDVASFPMDLQTGDVVSGHPMVFDLLDVTNKTIKDSTFSFWMNARRTKGRNIPKIIFALGTENTLFTSRFSKALFQTGNTKWNGGVELSMGYSSVEETWIHLGFTFSNGKLRSYIDGYAAEEQTVSNAFAMTRYASSENFLSLPDDGSDIKLKHFIFDNTVWTAKQMRTHVEATAPVGSMLLRTRIPEQGFGEIVDTNAFRKKFLFGPMPGPFEFPRLLFGPDDLPELRAMYRANDRMGDHLARAEIAIQIFKANQAWLEPLGVTRTPTQNQVTTITNLLFGAILLEDNGAHDKLAAAVMRIIRSKKDKIEAAVAKSTESEWEKHGLDQIFYKDGLAMMLDLAGSRLSMPDREEALSILMNGARGRRAIYTKHVTSDSFSVYADKMRFASMRTGSNRDLWGGCTLATTQLLLHGHPGHDPTDIYRTYNVFQEQIRSTISRVGTSTESIGKTALWRGFLPWIMLARHRIPGIDMNMWNHPRVQAFASQKALIMMPPAPLTADQGTYSKSIPRSHWAAFYTLLDSPANDRRNAWLARVVNPQLPLGYETSRRLFAEKGTASVANTLSRKASLLFLDDSKPVTPVYSESGVPVGFSNSERSCVATDGPLETTFASKWNFTVEFFAGEDLPNHGKLFSLYEEGAAGQLIEVFILDHGTALRLKVRGQARTFPIPQGTWVRYSIFQSDASTVSDVFNNTLPMEQQNMGPISIVLGAYSNLAKRLGANQNGSQAKIRSISLGENGELVYLWDRFNSSHFGRTMNKYINLCSLFDFRDWRDDIAYSDTPTGDRVDTNLLDDSFGFYSFTAGRSAEASAAMVFGQDISGGHASKMGGHFDVYGVGTAWLFVENRLCVGAENYNTILVDRKAAPGTFHAEQGLFMSGDVTPQGGWVEIDLTWFYRHAGQVHRVNEFGFNENCGLTADSIASKFSRRVVSHIPIGNRERSVTLIRDELLMLDGKNHTFTWLGQIMQRHGVRIDRSPPSGLLDIWLDGDADIDLSKTFRSFAPLTVRSVSSLSQFSSRFSLPRRCLIRVLRADSSVPLDVEVRDRFRRPYYNQGIELQQVVNEKTSTFSKRIAKQLRVQTEGTEGHFIIAIYSLAVGEKVPDMSYSASTDEVTLSLEREMRVVNAKGVIREPR